MSNERRPDGNGESDSVGRQDPLGELIEKHEATLASALFVFVALDVVGMGLLAYALTRDPWSRGFALVGGAVLLVSGALFVLNLFNVGRRLELRRRGIRMVEREVQREVLWGEIVEIEVDRADETSVGPVSIEKRSSDPISPSGPLTKTEWQVTIHTRDGQSIRLSRGFLRLVPDPRKLVSHLRMRSGVP